MKSKLLFGALLGSIALASCNADEDLATSQAQKSPIKFTVSLETANGDTPSTKAILTDKFKINFENNDLMSLFHGATVNASAGNLNQTITGYQNAIYAGTAEDGKTFSFTTKSMVLESGAIMVYPADTTFANTNADAPKVSIAQHQDENTVKLMPYMSEVLDIKSYDGDAGANTAGYDKYYPVVLKPIGSVLALQIDPTNADRINNLGVAELKVTKAQLGATGAIFTTGLYVKATDAAIAYTGDDALINGLWDKASDVDLTDAHLTTVAELTTTNVSNDKAVFTLLPAKASIDGTGAKVTINTNYGKVELAATNEVWVKGTAAAVSVKDGLEDVLNNTWVAPSTASPNFGTEKTGGLFNRKITADMSTLNMNGLHITDQQHLLDALKVYDAIAKDATVTFYLDGDAKGEFVMEAAAAAAYEARVANDQNQITFELSTDQATKCDAVKFVSTTETEVPAVLKFGTTVAPIKFAGLWKYSESKTFDYVASLEIVEGATMTMSEAIKATVRNNASGVTITNNGTVNISGETDLALSMDNNGTINIPVGAEFYMNNAKLTNEATDLNTCGEIINNGILGVRQNTSGEINNFGYIKQGNGSAFTYVTSNASSAADFAADFNPTSNKIGTIELYGLGNENTAVDKTGKPGFIKVITTAASISADEVGKYANYVEITGACTACSDLPTTVQYVEVKSSEMVVWTTTQACTVIGLIVDNNYKLNIPNGSEVTATTTYLKGKIFRGGEFTCTDFDGYLGGAAADGNNVITSK